ncbi:hypothetical protein SNOG_14259 [Parastagonospora nodorum SN15]|uniref:Uncharacterized protein n=2 Tax=Phaeosphaeria nodorum (strain SN15 / ATCC MYA-4574 / FGSC 10173) TaxID=321614 RepID=A0A7U2I4E2_PHANO|nr:hypothetical protein SNOG_14259 [Parastagonospora nodorum SN15]EAT78496.1 hypothetical protein SNOG_14259 [Parastagonospora nodorum SN15]QRD02946.1 hypothetical protein JI435_142590 [Parastagonospora nodorum SN15]
MTLSFTASPPETPVADLTHRHLHPDHASRRTSLKSC